MRSLRGRHGLFASAAALLMAALTLPLATAAQAASADAGLFGAGDPTYDGVYRQSLAILALREAGAPVPESAITWLAGQQCLDGAYTAYRVSIRTACPMPDPANFSGPDSNSTALAAMALAAVGKKEQANKAVRVLVANQNADGGWGYTLGSPSDANSTGLVLAAFDESSSGEIAAERKGLRYLRNIAGDCAHGASHLPYQADQAANTLASAQALLGLNTGLPIHDSPAKYTKARHCTEHLDQRVAEYLVDELKKSGGLLASPMDASQPDFNTTAWTVLGLVGANRPARDVATAVSKLKSGAQAFVGKGMDTSPAAAATLAIVANHVDADMRKFGGVDLISAIKGTLRS